MSKPFKIKNRAIALKNMKTIAKKMAKRAKKISKELTGREGAAELIKAASRLETSLQDVANVAV